jgi:hypothetical protein
MHSAPVSLEVRRTCGEGAGACDQGRGRGNREVPLMGAWLTRVARRSPRSVGLLVSVISSFCGGPCCERVIRWP